MKSRFSRLGLFIFFVLPCLVISQTTDNFIAGVLLDAETNEPLAFATLRLKGKALGVISNIDGSFKIPESLQSKGERLEISSMGYETMTLFFSDLDKNEINLIYIKPAILQLNETVVTARKKRLSAKKIIRRAIARIPENYPNDPFNLRGYYRDYQFKKDAYVNLNEAIVGIYDQGFNNKDYHKTEYEIYSYQKNKTFQIDSFAAKPYDYDTRDKYIPDAKLISNYGGNELVILNIHDAIRNHDIKSFSYINRLTKDFITAHRFPKMKTTSYDGQEVFEIVVTKKEPSFYVEGAIYIDKDDYSIRKLDYAVYRRARFSGNDKYEKKKNLLYEILVEYKEENERMYLNYISFHNIFTIRRPAKFKMEQVFLDKENGLLDVKFNKPMADYDHIYEGGTVYFQGNNLPVSSIVQSEEDRLSVILSKKKQDVVKRKKILDNLKEGDMLEVFIDIKNLRDREGNLLNERKEETLNQFREFFTQEIVAAEAIQTPLEYMLKAKPLYDSLQPVSNSISIRNNWMNTPLKSKE